MSETGEQQAVPTRGSGSTSLWLGLLAVALAVPPAVIFFIVPGYWLGMLNITAYLSPVLALLSLTAGYRARGAPRARAGIVLSVIALALSAAWLLRGFYLFRTAIRTACLWWYMGGSDCGAQAVLIDALRTAV